MRNAAVRAALERLWTDTATFSQWAKVTDETTKLTEFQETPPLTDQPCKLSFETLTSSDGEPVAPLQQAVKLILSPDVTVPPGCKVTVKRPTGESTYQTFVFQSSGEPGIFHNHQEIMLELFKGWA